MSLVGKGASQVFNDELLFDNFELTENISNNFEINNNSINALTIQDGTQNITIQSSLTINEQTNIKHNNDADDIAMTIFNSGMGTDKDYLIKFGKENTIGASGNGDSYGAIEYTHAGTNDLNNRLSFGTGTSRFLELRKETSGTTGRVNVLGKLGINASEPNYYLTIGDNDTGIDWVSDGIIRVMTDNNERLKFGAGADGEISFTTGINRVEITQSSTIANQQVLSLRRTRDNDTQIYLQMFKNTTSGVGQVEDIASTLTLTSASDKRLKKNITEYTGGYNIVKNLEAKTFDWKYSESNNCRGFIAQDFLKDVPKCIGSKLTHLIDGVETECYTMSHTALIPELWSAVRKLIQDKERLEIQNKFLLEKIQKINKKLKL